MKRLLIMFFVSTVYHALYSMDFNQPSDAYLKDFAFNFFMHGYIKSLDIDSHRQENTQSINDNEIPAAKREPIVFNQDEKS